MSQPSHADRPLPAHARRCSGPPELASILYPGHNLALWPRPLAPALRGFLDEVAAKRLPTLHQESSPDRAAGDLHEHLERAGVPATAERDAWIADMTEQVERLCAIAGDHRVEMRLERVTDDACRMFHMDHKQLRLICTYRGPGTEWLSEEQTDRRGLGQGDNGRILRGGEPWRMETGWVAILKGSRFPGDGMEGIVHRSPPLERPTDTRLFFRVDIP